MVGGHGPEAEDMRVTTLFTVGITKFRTLVVGVSWGVLSTGGTMVMEIVWAEVVGGLAHIALSWNVWT